MGGSSLKTSVSLGVAIAACMIVVMPASARTEKVLYSFCQSSGCPDGQQPYSPMVQDSNGNLFGTTLAGGNASNAGTIYELQKVKRTWVFHSLYSFCAQANCADGSTPYGGLIVDTSGNLYGTTLMGGNANDGVVFELQKSGTFQVLYSFCAQTHCADGAQPYAGLTYQGQQSGQLYDGISTPYGTTSSGGVNYSELGIAFSMTPDGTETVLHAFAGGTDGAYPYAPLIADSEGNLYGTTNEGGLPDNGGTIFEIDGSGNETVLLVFGGEGENSGIFPGTGALLMPADGTLVGTTPVGGDYSVGVIYSFAAGTYTTLAHFCRHSHCRSGGSSQSALIEDASGNFYGVAPLGGKNGSDKGTVFELTGSTLESIYSFCAQANCADGAEPYSKLIMNARGALLGTTTQGGAYGGGTIFELP